MNDPRWFEDDDPSSLPRRVERVLGTLQRHAASRCATCERPICGHAVLFSLVAGRQDEPTCVLCLAAEHERSPLALRDELVGFVQAKPCLAQGWRFASLREGDGETAGARCPRSLEPADDTGAGGRSGGGVAPASAPATATDDPAAALAADETWDAGDEGCGDLVLKLRQRMSRMAPGTLLALRATDPGAPQDIPAWCRLTGHTLERAAHPSYVIRRKEAP